MGSQGADTLIGGEGNDFIFGDNGNDVAWMGTGDDVFEWDPGDGNDTVEGEAGTDQLLFFGANIGEVINIAANGSRALFTRDIASVTMDLNSVEKIEYRALGGADTINVGDLTGTGVAVVDIDLRGPNGGGDGAADAVTVNGSIISDVIGVSGSGGAVSVTGLPGSVNIGGSDSASDRLTISGGQGDDVMNASALAADSIQLTMNGGLGIDLMTGSQGGDVIIGGDGNDTAFMGAGDDTFVWNPGDDNDTVEGQDGYDTLLFNGANIGETINISANGSRVTFARDIAGVTMDVNGTEEIVFKARGGADTINVGDLSGTDVGFVNIDLSANGDGGAGDGAADTIHIYATNDDDVVFVAGDNGVITVYGLTAQVNITGFEAANDKIVVHMLDGDDVFTAEALGLGIAVTADGGDGDDVMIGHAGTDFLYGGIGDDVLIGNGGFDVLDGGAGSNIILP